MKKKFLFGILVLALLSAFPAQAKKRRFKYYLDPSRAESILSNIRLNGPLTSDRWLSLLGPKSTETYFVQPGDNLWKISSRSFGDPKLWRKLWQVNPNLTNPHDINVGQLLQFNRTGRDPASMEIPLVKLIPNRPGASNDLDSDTAINLEIKNQFRPSVFIMEETEILGELTGSFSGRNWLSDTDSVYLRLNKEEAVPEKTAFSIVRVEHDVADPVDSDHSNLGVLVHLVGEVHVLATSEPGALVKAEVKRHLGAFKRGDKVIAVRDPVRPPAIFNPPADFQARIVMGEVQEAHYFNQGQIVILNKGESDEMKAGYLFRVIETMDPRTESESTVNADYKGEIQVVTVSKFSSVGLILRNKMPLVVGDVLVAAQLFTEPPPPPRRQIKEIDID